MGPVARESRIVPIRMTPQGLRLLDQRKLPSEETYVICRSVSDVVRAIANMTVRGAPAIGVTAAYGYALGAKAPASSRDALLRRLARHGEKLRAARPTAVNLAWAVDRMERLAVQTPGSPRAVARALMKTARQMHEDDIAINRRIGGHGQRLLPRSGTVLTHCNAGALATAGYGTALGVIRSAVAAGKDIAVLADETRPFLQGARLTAWELAKDRIPVTVAADGAAGHLIASGEVRAVIVGADRIAMNGDVANKIGTYPLACLAQRHGIPFLVAAPVSTVDPNTPTGASIPIEERPEAEVHRVGRRRITPSGVAARNPAFDVTPAELVTAIITEEGVHRAPFGRSLGRLSFDEAPPRS